MGPVDVPVRDDEDPGARFRLTDSRTGPHARRWLHDTCSIGSKSYEMKVMRNSKLVLLASFHVAPESHQACAMRCNSATSVLVKAFG